MYFRPGRNCIAVLIIMLAFTVFSGGVRNKAVKYNEEGVKLLNEKKYQAASEVLTKALVYAPESKKIKKNLAYAYNAIASQLFYESPEKDIDKVIDLFGRAAELVPDIEVYRVSLSVALTTKGKYLYDQRLLEESQRYILEALGLNHENVDAWIILGDISFFMQRLMEARDYWLKALSVDPNSVLASQRLMDLKASFDVEKDFKKLIREHFIITYATELKREEVYGIEGMLEEAYRDVGQDFNFFPEGKIVVLLYESADFIEYIDALKWARGLYDGKVRIPVSMDDKIDEYKGVVYHEYTHALIHILIQENCPIWLNEGLATYQENRFHKRSLKRLKEALKSDRVIPIEGLDSAFRSYEDFAIVSLAYEESFYLIKYIVDQYNWDYAINLLRDFSEEKNTKKNIEKRFNTSFDEFEKSWVKYMKEKLL